MAKHSYLLSAEGALPGEGVSQKKTLELAQAQNSSNARQKKLLKAVYEKVSIEARHSVLGEDRTADQTSFADFFVGEGPGTRERMRYFESHAPRLAHLAAEKAMKAAAVTSKEIAHLVSVSCTGFASPGFDISILKSLNLDPSVSRTHVGFMGCHGVFNAFRVAAALSKPSQDVLVSSVELCSLHYRYGGELREVLGNALFSDGAGAAVISSKKRASGDWHIAAQNSFIIPDSEDAIRWRVGDLGFEMELSPKIRPLIENNLRPWLEEWLTKENLKIENIRSWAVHPGGPGVLDAVEKSIGLDETALQYSRSVLKRCGNMSSATILFILNEIMRKKNTAPCIALGFGPGLTIEAALFL